MTEIKFCGESAIGTVYGFYVEREGKAYIVNDTGTMVSVENVSQLVGYDIDGKEIYEGDIMYDVDGNKYIAHFDSRVLWEGSKTFKHWTLPFKQSSSDYEECSLPMEFFNEVEKKRRKTDWLKKE